MKNIDKIITILNQANLPHTQFVDLMETFQNPYLVLISCILSLRTNDKTTYPATLRMLKLAKTPEEMSKINAETLSNAIYPVGFYKNKAQQIIDLSKLLLEKYDGKVPNTIEELTKIKGVGRKTANLTLAKGFQIPAICVDVHVHRISNRLKWVNTKTPDETEIELRKILPKKYWLEINTILVTFGQNICKPTNPKCEICPIKKFCQN